jgi:predicted RNA-binding protein with PIN domain
MPYIVDGHNLIPKVSGLSLGDMDDELQLVKLLQEFCRIRHKQVEVYFDNAPAGSSGARTFGCVVARFVRQGHTADQAIQSKLRRLGGEARNWTVVSSDREVRTSARSARAKSMRVEEFAQQLNEVRMEGSGHPGDLEAEISSQEVDEWLELFGIDEGDEEG